MVCAGARSRPATSSSPTTTESLGPAFRGCGRPSRRREAHRSRRQARLPRRGELGLDITTCVRGSRPRPRTIWTRARARRSARDNDFGKGGVSFPARADWALVAADSLHLSPTTPVRFHDAGHPATGVPRSPPWPPQPCSPPVRCWLEPLRRLDKMRTGSTSGSGITALVAAGGHWWFTTGHLFASGSGVRDRAHTAPAGQTLIESRAALAHPVGEWAFYIAAALILIALLKASLTALFAYNAPLDDAGLPRALVFHGCSPTGLLVAADRLGARGSAFSASAQRSLPARRLGSCGASGAVESQTWYPELRVPPASCGSTTWRWHRPGQFCPSSPPRDLEGAHPFSIASDWDPAPRRIVFIAKALGDYNARPPRRDSGRGVRSRSRGPMAPSTSGTAVHPRSGSAPVSVSPLHRPYCKQLARTGSAQDPIFHSTADVSEAALDRMRADAEAAGVALHLTPAPPRTRCRSATASAPPCRLAAVGEPVVLRPDRVRREPPPGFPAHGLGLSPERFALR